MFWWVAMVRLEWEKPHATNMENDAQIFVHWKYEFNWMSKTELPSMRLSFIYSNRNYLAYRKIGPESGLYRKLHANAKRETANERKDTWTQLFD